MHIVIAYTIILYYMYHLQMAVVRASLISWQPPREESTASHGMNHIFSFILVSILSWMVLLTFAGTLDSLRTGSGASRQSQPGTTAQYQ